jgi:hypothetical protein
LREVPAFGAADDVLGEVFGEGADQVQVAQTIVRASGGTVLHVYRRRASVRCSWGLAYACAREYRLISQMSP